MKSRLASVRTDGGLDRVDRAVQLLEEEWRRHGEVRLETFWAGQNRGGAAGPVDSLGLLAALVKADLRLRYDQGQTPTAAGYLQRFPELRGSDSRLLSLVYEEYCLSEERGRAPDVDSFCDRYPELKSSLASQLRYHRLLSQAAGVSPSLPRFPEPGENFEEFHLLSDLGTGGTSRVFLARDLSLGGKQVALKVTVDRGQEPKVQGALDHPHIVPVNAVIYQTEGQLCGLSMPFRPGLPLDEVIRRVNPAGRPGKAMALWDSLHDETAGGPSPDAGPVRETIDPKRSIGRPGPRGDGWDGFPVHGTYAQGVAWIVMILARALQYAHGKVTYHRDVKPANVLLTRLNGPQLLDFNLAESPHSADRARAALHGGTPPYMAPEQIEAFLNPDLWGKVGARADIYSLGLVFRELLTGQMPELPDKRLSPSRELRDLLDRRPFLDVAVRRFNPAIPHSLAAVVAKCLALSPDDRYSSAESLAQDLERFLTHQPLLKAVNPSRCELLSNWVTRQRPVLAGIAGVFGVVTLGILLSRLTNDLYKPSVETLPSFQSAVRYVEQGECQRAVDLLSQLPMENPHSCLIKFYLSVAHASLAPDDDDKKKEEAQAELRAALAAPDAESTLVAWAAKDHPELARYLVNFADATIKRVDQDAEDYDSDNPKDDERRDRLFRWSSYELPRDALRLALKVGPDSPTIQRLLAKTEEIFRDYALAHQRLTQLINKALSGGVVDDSLFFCRKLRGRVAFLWVDDRRRKKEPPDAETLTLLEQAREDLKWCAFYLGTHTFDIDHELKEYRVLHDRVRAMLTLAEVQIDLNCATEAQRHLEAAQKRFKSLSEQADPYKLKGCDLRLMSLVKDVGGIPTAAKSLIIVAAVDHVFHFRIFDVDGKVVVDTDEKRLTKQARQIEDLRNQLESLWPRRELTKIEKDRVIDAATSIVGRVQLKVPYPTRLEERITAGWSRLAALDSAGRPDSEISSNQSSKDGLKSGYAIARQESDVRRSSPDGTRLPSAP